MKSLFLHPHDILRIPDPSIQILIARAGIEVLLRGQDQGFDPDAPSVVQQLETAGRIGPGDRRLLAVRDAVAHGNAGGYPWSLIRESCELHFRIYASLVDEFTAENAAPPSFSELHWPGFEYQVSGWIRGAGTVLKFARERLDGSLWAKLRATRGVADERENFRRGVSEFRACLEVDLIRHHPGSGGGTHSNTEVRPLPPGCLPIHVIESIPDDRVLVVCAVVLFEYLIRQIYPSWFEPDGSGETTLDVLVRHAHEFVDAQRVFQVYRIRNRLLHPSGEVEEFKIVARGVHIGSVCTDLAAEAGGELVRSVLGATSHPLWNSESPEEMCRRTREALAEVLALSQWTRGRSRFDPLSWLTCVLDMVAGDEADLRTFRRTVTPPLEAVLADDELISLIATGETRSSGLDLTLSPV